MENLGFNYLVLWSVIALGENTSYAMTYDEMIADNKNYEMTERTRA